MNYSCHVKSSRDRIAYRFSNSSLSMTVALPNFSSSFYCLIHYTSQMVLFSLFSHVYVAQVSETLSCEDARRRLFRTLLGKA